MTLVVAFPKIRKLPIYIGSFRYILEASIYIYDKIHSKLEQKKPTKYIVNFRCRYVTKYTLSLNKKRLQNMSEIFDMVHISQVGNLAEVSHDFRDIIHNFVSKHKGNCKHVNDILVLWKLWQSWHRWYVLGYLCVQDFRFPAICFAHEIMSRKSCDTSARFPTWLIWTISKNSDIFCRRFLFKLRVYFIVNIYRKLPIYVGNLRYILQSFFVPTQSVFCRIYICIGQISL